MSHGNRKSALGPSTADHFVIVEGKRVYFSFGYRFGPWITDLFGEPLHARSQPRFENSPFWPPFETWLREHMKVDPPPPLIRPSASAQHNRDPQP